MRSEPTLRLIVLTKNMKLKKYSAARNESKIKMLENKATNFVP